MPTGTALIRLMEQTPIIPNSLALFGLGQMGVAIKGPEATIYLDPCLSDVLQDQLGDWWKRAYAPPLLPSDVTNAAYYLVTHEHQDHLDPITAGTVAKASPSAKFVASKWCLGIFSDIDIPAERVLTPEALVPTTLPGTSLRLTAVPSAHYEKDYDAEKGYRWLGYVIEWNGVTFYHSGDTIIYSGYVETLRGLPRPDVAMVPVNGRDWYREREANVIGNLLPSEAARLSGALDWGVLIPGHNDLYPNNTIPMAHVTEALAAAVPRQKVKMLQPGELYYYVRH